jgi:eukaryotic-like serine/threonine-protein kinase
VEPGRLRRRQRTLAVAVGAATVVASVVVAALIAGPGGGDTGALADQVSADPEATGTTGGVTATTAPADPPAGDRGPGEPALPGGATSGPATPTIGPTPGRTPTTPAPTLSGEPTPEGSTRTLASAGGTVVARCEGRQAHALSWDAADGYTVGKTEPGPAGTVHVWFDGPQRVHMKIQCKDGFPTSVNSPN